LGNRILQDLLRAGSDVPDNPVDLRFHIQDLSDWPPGKRMRARVSDDYIIERWESGKLARFRPRS
jgi:hypothetical protein